MRIQSSAISSIGRRDNNEDAFCALPGLGLFTVADGMGGYEGGEVASQLAVSTMCDFFQRYQTDREVTWPFAMDRSRDLGENLLAVSIRSAHEAIATRRVGVLSDMGSTVVALFLAGRRAIVGHVGDSRLYRLRGGELRQLTRDHSLFEEMRSAGVDQVGSKKECAYANVITRALGLGERSAPEVRSEQVYCGDVFLLCTDGLSDPLTEEQMMAPLSELPPQSAAKELVQTAFEAGSRDNITALVVKVIEA